jgi:hypothetical protein
MVMFHHDIPYRVAFERGRVKAAIVEELVAGVQSVEEIPAERMASALAGRLDPIG